jgi:hypothetical protein
VRAAALRITHVIGVPAWVHTRERRGFKHAIGVRISCTTSIHKAARSARTARAAQERRLQAQSRQKEGIPPLGHFRLCVQTDGINSVHTSDSMEHVSINTEMDSSVPPNTNNGTRTCTICVDSWARTLQSCAPTVPSPRPSDGPAPLPWCHRTSSLPSSDSTSTWCEVIRWWVVVTVVVVWCTTSDRAVVCAAVPCASHGPSSSSSSSSSVPRAALLFPRAG